MLSQKEYEKKLHEKFPNEEFSILDFSSIPPHSVQVRCNTCGTIRTLSRARALYDNAYFCRRCGSKIYKEFLQNLTYSGKEVLEEGRTITRDNFTIRCKKCGGIFYKEPWAVVRKTSIKCPYCESPNPGHKYIDLKKRVKDVLGEDYQLLDGDPKTTEKVHIKHKCGFVFSGKIHNLLRSNGCPKCYGKKSKGELRIAKWLVAKKIPFEQEYCISKRQRIDFLVNSDFAIEYNGIQHYKDVAYWNNSQYNSLESNKRRDAQKKEWCEKHSLPLLIIPYWEYNNIESILEDYLVQRLSEKGVKNFEAYNKVTQSELL